MTQELKWNNTTYEISRVSSVLNGDQGTVWKYETTRNRSLIVVPFESEPFTVGEATTAPELILPTLAGRRGIFNPLRFLFDEIVLGDEIKPEALEHVRQFIEKFGMPEPEENEIVKPFYDALVQLRGQSVFSEHYSEILDELELITKGEIQAQDVKERLFLDFSEGMPNYLLKFGQAVSEVRGISDIDALNFILNSCPYVADFGNGTFRLLRSVKLVSGPDPLPESVRAEKPENHPEIMQAGKRFDLLSEYHCIRDKVGKCEYHVTDGTAAHRALKAFVEKTDASNRLPAARIRELMPNSSGLENKPKRWFECGIKPGKAAPDFMEEIFPALIKNESGLWWIDLDGG